VAKQIDKLKKIKYKASRLQGNSIRQGLRDAGYTEASASHSSALGVVKCSERELMNEITSSDVTVEWVVNRLTSEIRILELFGKYLNMFKDAQNTQVTIFNDPNREQDARLIIEQSHNIAEKALTQSPQGQELTTT
jgi:hypothetical protein